MLSASTEVGSGIVSADFNAFASMQVVNDTAKQFTIEKGEKVFFLISVEPRWYYHILRIYEIDQNEFFGD